MEFVKFLGGLDFGAKQVYLTKPVALSGKTDYQNLDQRYWKTMFVSTGCMVGIMGRQVKSGSFN